jgi:hypothetical protein
MKRIKAFIRRCQRGWRGRVTVDSNGVMHLTMLARVAHWGQERNWSAFDTPTYVRKPRANVARMKIERARKIPDMPVPTFLRRQAD